MLPSYVIVASVLLLAFRYALIRTARPLKTFFGSGPWGDALAYFLQIQYYRKYSGAELDPRCLFRGKSLHRPSWYHRVVLNTFSDAMLWSKPWLPNLVLYGIGTVAFLGVSVPMLEADFPSSGILLALLFLAQADNSRFDDQSVHYLTLQPRLLGAVALSLHALIFALMPAPIVAVSFGSLAVLIAINTSVFSRQAAYFVLPLASLLSWNAVPLINLALATLLSLILNRDEFVDSFRAHVRYAKWYFNSYYLPRQGAGLAYLIRRTFAPPVRFLPRYLDSALAAMLLLLLIDKMDDPFVRRALGMIGGALIVCGITSIRKFASLGECGRYLSFTCYFLTPLAIVYALPLLNISFEIAYVLASLALLRNVLFTFRGRGDLSNPIREITALLESVFAGRETPSVWWSAHFRYGSIPVALGWGAATFEIQGTDLSADAMASLFAKYPFLHCNEEFFDKHRVTHLLISKAEWPQEIYGPLDATVGAHQVLAESQGYVILSRTRA